MDTDLMNTPWWIGETTVSGENWQADYTRSRYGIETTYSGVDTLIGRKDSIADVNP
jgi:hypothetical protein